MSETADRVKKIVVEHLGVEPDKVTEDASFIDDLGADSLDIGLYRPEQGLIGAADCRPAAPQGGMNGFPNQSGGRLFWS